MSNFTAAFDKISRDVITGNSAVSGMTVKSAQAVIRDEVPQRMGVASFGPTQPEPAKVDYGFQRFELEKIWKHHEQNVGAVLGNFQGINVYGTVYKFN